MASYLLEVLTRHSNQWTSASIVIATNMAKKMADITLSLAKSTDLENLEQASNSFIKSAFNVKVYK